MSSLRRAAITLTLGVGAIGGAIGAAGVAGATAADAAISAKSAPTIASTGSNQAAGTLTIAITSGVALAGKTLTLTVTSHTGKVTWHSVSAVTSGMTETGTATKTGDKLTLKLTKSSANAGTVDLSAITYTTTKAYGKLTVTPALTGVTFAPTSVSNATLASVPPAAPTFTLTAKSALHVADGKGNQPAGTWTLTMHGQSGTTGTTPVGWTAGDYVLLAVAPSGGNCATATKDLSFATTPKVSASDTGASSAPTVTASITKATGCKNIVKLTFTNAGTFSTKPGTAAVTLTSVLYTVGKSATAGAVGVTGAFYASGTKAATVVTTKASNAVVGESYVAANTPPVTVKPGAFDASISPVDVVESAPSHLSTGEVCLTLSSGSFTASATPKVTVTGGNGKVSTASYLASSKRTTGTGYGTVEFAVTTASTTTATYSVSGLAVNAPGSGTVTVAVTDGATATCTGGTSLGSAAPYTLGSPTTTTQIYGATADATAAAELAHQFAPRNADCPGTGGYVTRVTRIDYPPIRPVVLATDANYPDALASAYLAQYLYTGTLLTPTGSLSSVTANAIRQEGITHVYVVGGPIAVSTTVVNQLESTQAYECGGTTPVVTLGTGKPVDIQVTRIYGQTQYDTAQQIAQFVPSTNVGTENVAGAYAGTNGSGGNGRYNDTAGKASSAPVSSGTLRTAIVATGQGFQDAESSSTMSYATGLPILLTTPSSLSSQVSSAIENLKIKQVIVMGGPLAVANTVVTSVEKLGVSVLRVAGQDATDTAVQLADFEVGSTTGLLGLGWSPGSDITIARGDFYSDGLAGAVVAAGNGRTNTHNAEPLLLTENPTTVGTYLTSFLKKAGKTGIDGSSGNKVSYLTILGGPEAVSPATIQQMETDLKS